VTDESAMYIVKFAVCGRENWVKRKFTPFQLNTRVNYTSTMYLILLILVRYSNLYVFLYKTSMVALANARARTTLGNICSTAYTFLYAIRINIVIYSQNNLW
jgi:hypothetical protein